MSCKIIYCRLTVEFCAFFHGNLIQCIIQFSKSVEISSPRKKHSLFRVADSPKQACPLNLPKAHSNGTEPGNVKLPGITRPPASTNIGKDFLAPIDQHFPSCCIGQTDCRRRLKKSVTVVHQTSNTYKPRSRTKEVGDEPGCNCEVLASGMPFRQDVPAENRHLPS